MLICNFPPSKNIDFQNNILHILYFKGMFYINIPTFLPILKSRHLAVVREVERVAC